jgi:type I restriction enzyme M protein
LFYTTDISVTLWILNKNKKEQTRSIGDKTRHYRNREKEILFMDLRQMGEPFEKKYTQFSDADIQKVTSTYHQWQTNGIENIPEFCHSASFDEVVNRDENIDFDEKMQALQSEFTELLKAEKQSKMDLLKVFSELGYQIKL